jgi:flagellar biosynthesis/type III secretory pathway chaperone
MTWFDLIKSSEMKEFEILAEKYAKPNDMKHLDYLRKKHGKKSNEFYDTLEKQIRIELKDNWSSIPEIIKHLRNQNPKLKDSDENLTAFLRKRLESMDVETKQETASGRTGKKTYYKV